MIRDWCHARVKGLQVMHDHECGGESPTAVQVAEWIVRCLANTRCDGSAEVLEAIIKWRANEGT